MSLSSLGIRVILNCIKTSSAWLPFSFYEMIWELLVLFFEGLLEFTVNLFGPGQFFNSRFCFMLIAEIYLGVYSSLIESWYVVTCSVPLNKIQNIQVAIVIGSISFIFFNLVEYNFQIFPNLFLFMLVFKIWKISLFLVVWLRICQYF